MGLFCHFQIDPAVLDAIRQELSSLKPIPCPSHDGILLPTFKVIREKGAERAMTDILNFQTRDSDIMLCTYPKSGTHFIYEIVHMLVKNTTELDETPKTKSMLELVDDLQDVDQLPSPRILDSHLPFRFLPRKLIADRCKIINVIRNPKDVCVSYYHHRKKDVCTWLEGSWDQGFEEFITGQVPYGSWFDYELEMEQAAKDYPGMIHTVHYEQMQRDKEKEIQRLAEFLRCETSTNSIKDIAKSTTFENMKDKKFDVTALLDGKGFIYRKGHIGDWKNYFTMAQNDRFNDLYIEKMKNSSYNIIFQ